MALGWGQRLSYGTASGKARGLGSAIQHGRLFHCQWELAPQGFPAVRPWSLALLSQDRCCLGCPRLPSPSHFWLGTSCFKNVEGSCENSPLW